MSTTELKPGQIKAIKLKIKDLSDLKQRLEKLYTQARSAQDFDDDFAREAVALQRAIQKKITELDQQLQAQKKTSMAPFEKIWNEQIATNCSQAIKAYKSSELVLFRGVIAKSSAFIGRSKENRKPKDSNKIVQELYDQMLTKMGIKALRSNSIFTTADYNHANQYGEVYIIFPINGFNFCYTKFDDLVLSSADSLVDKDLVKKIGKIVEAAKLDLNAFGILKFGWAQKNYYLDDGNPKNIQKFVDKLKKHPVLAKNALIRQLSLDMLLNPTQFAKKFKPSDKNLPAGMKAGVEVCVNGNYYAFAATEFGEYISEKLGFRIAGDHNR